MKILVAEDDGNMRKILKLYLQKEGYDVECVSDGEEVLNYFEEKTADILLLDWMMPKKDGIETCRELRLMKIPVKIIMLTAKTTSENEFHGLSIGADDYIRKPFDMKVLLIRIKKLCHIETELYFKDILLNQAAHEVYIGENRILLTNAIKYSSGRKILMELFEKQNQIIFKITNETDNQSLDISKIWEPYYVGEKSRNKNLSGTGLGLSIVKKICETQFYEVECTRDGKNIIFTVIIPCKPAA